MTLCAAFAIREHFSLLYTMRIWLKVSVTSVAEFWNQESTGSRLNFKFHARVQKCHFAKSEKLPKWHFWTLAWNSWKNLCQKHSFEASLWKCFLKKPSWDLKNYFCFGIVWIPLNAWEDKLEVPSFLPSKSMYRQCVLPLDSCH